MAVLQALQRTPSAIVRAPGLLVPNFILYVLLVPQFALQSSHPFLAMVASLGFVAISFILVPFLQGGLLGMADEALHGTSSLRTFVEEGKNNYLSILVAYAVLLVVNGILGAILFAAGFGALLSQMAGILGIVLLIVVGVTVLAYLLITFFVQFYGQAIVIDNTSALASFKRSYQVVRSNLLATFGYVVLSIVFGGVAGVVYGGFSLLLAPGASTIDGLPALSMPSLIVIGLVMTVFSSLVSVFVLTFSVAFYNELTGNQKVSPL
jgi:hypothetical protein